MVAELARSAVENLRAARTANPATTQVAVVVAFHLTIPFELAAGDAAHQSLFAHGLD